MPGRPWRSNTIPDPRAQSWTRADLLRQVHLYLPRVADETFDHIREQAGIPGTGVVGYGNGHCYSRAELRRLIAAARRSQFRQGGGIADAWEGLLDEWEE